MIISDSVFSFVKLSGRAEAIDLESQSINQMTASSQVLVLISASCIDVDSDASEMSGDSFSRNTNSVGELGDLVELCRILRCMRSVTSSGSPRVRRVRG